MTERVASRTAVLVCQGRAVAHDRLAPGRFTDPVAYELLRAQERGVVDAIRADRAPAGLGARLVHETVRGSAALMAARTIAVDDAVRAAGHDQFVILGAGLDARAWRMPELAGVDVVEVDHPASQRDKRARLGERPATARSVRYAAFDLATQRLGAVLREVGYDADRPATWVWEGVVPYLTDSEVVATVAQVAAACAPGSVLVVNYQERSLTARLTRLLVRGAFRAAREPDPWADEPWRSLWSVAELADVLARVDLRVDRDECLLEVARREGIEVPGRPDLGRVAVARRT